jgi:hypothetical protein
VVLSLAIGGLGLAKLYLPGGAEQVEQLGLALGGAVVLAMIAAFALAIRAAQREGARA